MNDTDTLRREVSTQEPNVGDAELQIAIEAANTAEQSETSLVVAVIKKLREWRKRFLSTSALATERAKEYAASEKAAREQLLQQSAELNELQKLERQRAELDRKAKAQEAKLNALFAEFSAIPAQASALHSRLNAVATEAEKLGAPLQASFRKYYRQFIEGDNRLSMDIDVLGARLLTADIRREVLSDIEAEINAELQKLERRNVELSKVLGRPRHQLK